MKAGGDPEAVAKDALAYVAERVAPYKRVRRDEVIEAIPRTPSGKNRAARAHRPRRVARQTVHA